MRLKCLNNYDLEIEINDQNELVFNCIDINDEIDSNSKIDNIVVSSAISAYELETLIKDIKTKIKKVNSFSYINKKMSRISTHIYSERFSWSCAEAPPYTQLFLKAHPRALKLGLTVTAVFPLQLSVLEKFLKAMKENEIRKNDIRLSIYKNR